MLLELLVFRGVDAHRNGGAVTPEKGMAMPSRYQVWQAGHFGDLHVTRPPVLHLVDQSEHTAKHLRWSECKTDGPCGVRRIRRRITRSSIFSHVNEVHCPA